MRYFVNIPSLVTMKKYTKWVKLIQGLFNPPPLKNFSETQYLDFIKTF